MDHSPSEAKVTHLAEVPELPLVELQGGQGWEQSQGQGPEVSEVGAMEVAPSAEQAPSEWVAPSDGKVQGPQQVEVGHWEESG